LAGDEDLNLKCLECGHVAKSTSTGPGDLHFDAFERYQTELAAPDDEQAVVQLCSAVCRCVEYLHGGVHPEAGKCLALSAMTEGNREDAEEAYRIHVAFYGKNAAVTQGVQRRAKKVAKQGKKVVAAEPPPRTVPASESQARAVPENRQPTQRAQENGVESANGQRTQSAAQAQAGATLQDMQRMLEELRSERERLESLGREAIASGASTLQTLD
jgi:hypothetical protein